MGVRPFSATSFCRTNSLSMLALVLASALAVVYAAGGDITCTYCGMKIASKADLREVHSEHIVYTVDREVLGDIYPVVAFTNPHGKRDACRLVLSQADCEQARPLKCSRLRKGECRRTRRNTRRTRGTLGTRGSMRTVGNVASS